MFFPQVSMRQNQRQPTLERPFSQTNARSITRTPHSGTCASQIGNEQMSPKTHMVHPSTVSSSHFMISGKVLMNWVSFLLHIGILV